MTNKWFVTYAIFLLLLLSAKQVESGESLSTKELAEYCIYDGDDPKVAGVLVRHIQSFIDGAAATVECEAVYGLLRQAYSNNTDSHA